MTTQELIAKLQTLPPQAEVWLGHESEGQAWPLDEDMVEVHEWKEKYQVDDFIIEDPGATIVLLEMG
jgi:hypothetical protein